MDRELGEALATRAFVVARQRAAATQRPIYVYNYEGLPLLDTESPECEHFRVLPDGAIQHWQPPAGAGV
jgi:hypothetical protein